MEGVGDEKAVVVVIKECFVIKAVLTLLLLLLFFFLSFSLSLFFFLYFLARKKKERANKKNYFSCIRLMNFFINMQAVACHAFISREWLAGRKSERERGKKSGGRGFFFFSFRNKLHIRLGPSGTNFFSFLSFGRSFARFVYDFDPLCIRILMRH